MNNINNTNNHHALPVAALVIIDILIAGVLLCIYALFHHVIPQKLEADPVPVHESSADTLSSAPVGQSSEWFIKFKDKFTAGEVEKTPMTYKSANISVETSCIQTDKITYYLQDIYVADLKYLRSAFAKDTFGKGITQTVEQMAVNNNAIAAITGDYYGTHSNRGVVIRNGEVYRWQEAYDDVCMLYNNGTMKLFTEDFYNKNQEAVIADAWQGWCFGPILINNGITITDFDSEIAGLNPRTGIGYYEPGHYCFVVVDGRQDYSEGITLADFAKLFEELGCVNAYNLDGGKSAEMIFSGSSVNSPSDGGREISDIIMVKEVEE